MIIELSKNIYSQDSIMNAKTVWNNYFSKFNVSHNNENFIIDLESIKQDKIIIKEFLNYILDYNSRDK